MTELTACQMASYYLEQIKKGEQEYNKIEKIYNKCVNNNKDTTGCNLIKEDMVQLRTEIDRCKKRMVEQENKCEIYSKNL